MTCKSKEISLGIHHGDIKYFMTLNTRFSVLQGLISMDIGHMP